MWASRFTGSATQFGKESPDIPHFLPRRPNKTDAISSVRLAKYVQASNELVDFYIAIVGLLHKHWSEIGEYAFDQFSIKLSHMRRFRTCRANDGIDCDPYGRLVAVWNF